MPRSRVLMLTALAMLAFAGNSLLCRLALTGTTIDAASFTTDVAGVEYAIASGALASGVGYAIWYTALKGLPAASAATVQLSVPVIATIGGVILLGEHVTSRIVIASVAILGGIALVILDKVRAS